MFHELGQFLWQTCIVYKLRTWFWAHLGDLPGPKGIQGLVALASVTQALDKYFLISDMHLNTVLVCIKNSHHEIHRGGFSD